MSIKQGDIYWIYMELPCGPEPGFRRPYVVIQNNTLNDSRIETVVVCATLPSQRVRQILSGINLVLEPSEPG